MAVGLLARIDRGVAAEEVERFQADAERAAVADGADRPGIGKAGDDTLDRGVHRRGGGELVDDEAAFRAVTGKPPLVLDRLTGNAVAGEARQPQIGETG